MRLMASSLIGDKMISFSSSSLSSSSTSSMMDSPALVSFFESTLFTLVEKDGRLLGKGFSDAERSKEDRQQHDSSSTLHSSMPHLSSSTLLTSDSDHSKFDDDDEATIQVDLCRVVGNKKKRPCGDSHSFKARGCCSGFC